MNNPLRKLEDKPNIKHAMSNVWIALGTEGSKMTDDLLNRLNTGSANELYDAITELGKEGLHQYAPYIVKFLEHTDADVRVATISALGMRLGEEGYCDTYFKMAYGDEDEQVRYVALGAWQHRLRYEKADPHIHDLLVIIENDEALSVRTRAYSAFMENIGKPLSSNERDYLAEIEDWEVFRSHCNIEQLKILLGQL